MKIKLTLLLLLAGLAITSVSCSMMTGFATSNHLSWKFVQSVGGIKVGNPKPISNGYWTLPIEFDVSGLTTLTTKPTTLNSALVAKDVRYKIEQDRLLVWIVACVVTERYSESHWNKGITLKGVNPGQYKVQYLNPDGSTETIRSVEIQE